MNNFKPKYFQTDRSIKTLDVWGKLWFDRVNGNSYNSSIVTVNHGLKNEFSFSVPFTYGYGDYYLQKAIECLFKMGVVSDKREYKLRELGVEVIAHKNENCLKREVVNHGLSSDNVYR